MAVVAAVKCRSNFRCMALLQSYQSLTIYRPIYLYSLYIYVCIYTVYISTYSCLIFLQRTHGLDHPEPPKPQKTRNPPSEATEMSAEPFQSFTFDGVVGLGLKALAVEPNFSIFQQLAKRLVPRAGFRV